MSTAEKVALLRPVVDQYPLAAGLAVLELPKSSWYYHQRQKVTDETKYAHLRPLLEEIARQHPAYGYRRTTTELQETYQEAINHKVVQRLHRQWGLRLLRSTRQPQPSRLRQIIVAAGERINLLAQLEQIPPLTVLQTDFTEVRYAGGSQKAYLMPIIGHVCKVAFGWAVGESANRTLALEAWRRARATLSQLAVASAGLIMHHDQDPVYTSYDWTGRLLLNEQMQLSYTLDGAKDNPEIEAFISRFKNENRSLLLDALTIEALQQVVNERMHYYNHVRRHSALGNQPPWPSLKQWLIAPREDRLPKEPSARNTPNPAQ